MDNIYKVVCAKNPEDLEKRINEAAQQGFFIQLEPTIHKGNLVLVLINMQNYVKKMAECVVEGLDLDALKDLNMPRGPFSNL